MEDLQEPRPSHQHLATACVTEHASKFGQKSRVYLESYRKNNEFLHGDQENLELLWLFKDKASQIHSEMAFKVERF